MSSVGATSALSASRRMPSGARVVNSGRGNELAFPTKSKEARLNQPDLFAFISLLEILQVNHLAISGGGRFHNGFRHGGVRVHRLDDFVPGGLQFTGHHHFGN